jgi:hypothetical protein
MKELPEDNKAKDRKRESNKSKRYIKKLSTLQEADEEKEGSDSDKESRKYGQSLMPEDSKIAKRAKSTFVPKFSKND